MRGLLVRLTGYLRPTYALLGVLSAVSLGFYWLGRGDPLVAHGSFGVFAFIVLVVAVRYLLKGPEVDRAQPMLTVSQQDIRIVNIEASAMEREGFRELLQHIVAMRRPLPPPTGIIIGSSADPSSIRELSPEEVRRLAEESSG